MTLDEPPSAQHEVPERVRACAAGDPQHEELKALVSLHATADGCADALYPGVHFYRISRPANFRKTHTKGPTFTAVVQGRKVARMSGVELFYDPCRYLVITGETEFEGTILEASRDRPYLAVSLDIPADVVAKTLLALAEADVEALEETVPAFIADLDAPIKSTVIRFLRAIDDPIERRIVARWSWKSWCFAFCAATRQRSCGAPCAAIAMPRRSPARCTSCARTPPGRCRSTTSRVTSP